MERLYKSCKSRIFNFHQMSNRVEKLSGTKVINTNFMSKSPLYETNFMDWLTQQKLADLAGRVQIFGSIFESVPEQDWEIFQ